MSNVAAKTRLGMLTPEQEQFCRLLVAGYNQTDAYSLARPYLKNWKRSVFSVRGSEWAKLPAVRTRVQQLTERQHNAAQAQTLVSIESLTREVDEARSLAFSTGNPAAAVSATKLKAQLHRHLEREGSSGDVLKDVIALLDGLDRVTSARNPAPPPIDVTPED